MQQKSKNPMSQILIKLRAILVALFPQKQKSFILET